MARLHAEIVTVRKYRGEIFDDAERERKRDVLRAVAETKRMEGRALAAEKKKEELEEKLKEERGEKYAIGAELEKVKGINQKLTAQVNKDFRNFKV